MLDHIGVAISDIEQSKAFYEAALKPLGIAKIYRIWARQDRQRRNRDRVWQGRDAVLLDRRQ